MATGGIGSLGEVAVANVAKEGAVQIAKSLSIRAITGMFSGTFVKAVDEVKQCSTADKNWSDFGKVHDKDGNFTKSGTAFAWATSALVGAFGGRQSFFKFKIRFSKPLPLISIKARQLN